MSKRQVIRIGGHYRVGSLQVLRGMQSVPVPTTVAENFCLVPGQKVTLSVKAGHRRRMFTGAVVVDGGMFQVVRTTPQTTLSV